MEASSVMDMARSLLNDQLGAVFTDAVQIPYLNMALRDLGQKLQLNDIPVTLDTSSPIIVVGIGIDNIGGPGGPALPSGFINAKQVWQRQTGTDNPFLTVPQYQFLPHWAAEDQTSYLLGWAYLRQYIHLIPSTSPIDVKIDYTASVIPVIADDTDEIDITNSQQYLGFKTAAYCAMFIGENPSRAQVLEGQAENAFNEMLGIETKGQQSIVTRRRPFRAGWKQRGYV